MQCSCIRFHRRTEYATLHPFTCFRLFQICCLSQRELASQVNKWHAMLGTWLETEAAELQWKTLSPLQRRQQMLAESVVVDFITMLENSRMWLIVAYLRSPSESTNSMLEGSHFPANLVLFIAKGGILSSSVEFLLTRGVRRTFVATTSWFICVFSWHLSTIGSCDHDGKEGVTTRGLVKCECILRVSLLNSIDSSSKGSCTRSFLFTIFVDLISGWFEFLDLWYRASQGSSVVSCHNTVAKSASKVKVKTRSETGLWSEYGSSKDWPLFAFLSKTCNNP